MEYINRKKIIYLDNAATSCSIFDCKEIFEEYTFKDFFNPSSTYNQAIQIKQKIESARKNILNNLGTNIGRLLFTSSGSEANNIALNGVSIPKGSSIVIGHAEHASVYNKAINLKSMGYNVIFAPVDINGKICINSFEKILDKSTKFVSIMHVNNETGIVNDIKLLNSIAKKMNKDIVFHSDGVQAAGKIPVSLMDLGIDLYTISAHKFGGIKGAGALYINKNINVKPFIYGGGQEFNLRSSTENVSAILCLEKAFVKKVKTIDLNTNNAKVIQKKLFEFFSTIDSIKIISDIKKTNNHIFTFALNNIKSEIMQHLLETKNILVGTGSACNSSKNNLRIADALNLEDSYKNGMIRLSISEKTTIEEIDVFIRTFETFYKTLKRKFK